MGNVIPFKRRLRLAWNVMIADDVSIGLYGLVRVEEDLVLIKIFARSWEEAEELRGVAEEAAKKVDLPITEKI